MDHGGKLLFNSLLLNHCLTYFFVGSFGCWCILFIVVAVQLSQSQGCWLT